MSSLTLLASINVASTLAHLITHLVIESVFASKATFLLTRKT